MVYHVKEGYDFGPGSTKAIPRTSVQPILFLSKLFNQAEKNYWPTELEIAGIIWVVKRIRYIVESTKTPSVIIYTDYSAAVPISRQTNLTTSSIDKLNLRLVRASQYLSSFDLLLRYKAGKSNTVPDALSRLQAKAPAVTEATGVLDVLYGCPVNLYDSKLLECLPDIPRSAFHITFIEISDDFKSRLCLAYTDDKHWKLVLDMLVRQQEADAWTIRTVGTQPEPNGAVPAPDSQINLEDGQPTRVRFKLRDGLIYYTSLDSSRERLCIPQAMEEEIFKLSYNNQFHGSFYRSYERIKCSIYIRHLQNRLRAYVEHCPECQIYQTKRHKLYGSLIPIDSLAVPFHTVAMDFIVILPEAGLDLFDALLITTNKFTKRNLLLPGRSN